MIGTICLDYLFSKSLLGPRLLLKNNLNMENTFGDLTEQLAQSHSEYSLYFCLPWINNVSNVGSWEIWDFNLYRVKRLGRDFVMETVTGCLSVEGRGSYAKSWGIQGGVCTSLPFVKHKPKELPDYSYVFLDCDRVFGEWVSTIYFTSSVQLFNGFGATVYVLTGTG